MGTTIIKNVLVFDGTKLSEMKSVVIENDLISSKTTVDTEIDGRGCTLLPGLIDSHVHLYTIENLQMAAKYGVTTMLDMGVRSKDIINELKNLPDLPNIFSCFLPAFAPGSPLVSSMKYPDRTEIKSKEDAVRHVNEQISNGSDYIKVILEAQGVQGGAVFPIELVEEIVDESHKHNKLVIAHCVACETFEQAANSGIDVITHTPFAMPLSQEIIDTVATKGKVLIPTMIMMKGIAEKFKKINPKIPFNYEFVKDSVTKFHRAGVKILAGTDANVNDPTTPCSVPHGNGLFDELELLVDAGLSPVEALKCATSEPAAYFGLSDRGVISEGMKADLLLVEGDPTKVISDIRKVKSVWINGQLVNI